MALGSRNFSFIDPSKAAIAGHFGLATATKLWELGQQEATPAVIVAGMVLFLCKGLNGQDKIGWPYLTTAEHLGSRAGLYRAAMAHKTYDPSHPRRTQGRQAVAYGLFNFRAYLSIINDLAPLSDPPVIPPQDPGDQWTTWSAWPWPEQRIHSRSQLFHARSTLSLIAATIMPLHRRYEARKMTKEHYDAALKIMHKLQHWYDALDPALKRLEVSSPQLIAIHNYYQLAITQLLSPFVLEPDGMTDFLPTGSPLRQAGLPHEMAVSTYSEALTHIHANVLHLDRQWSPRFPTPPATYAPLVHICMAAMPTLSSSPDARYLFSVGLLLCLRIARIFTAYRSILRSIRFTAQREGITLPELAHRVFRRLEDEYPAMPVLDKVQSTFIVDARLRHTDVDASTLEGLIKDMEEMNLG
ncbi:hypothetical protein Slin14017_G072050 [Septoria linicola]|nr:hypothetical protein Slin14017_G072050 [Septoria linicola]